MNYAIGLTGYPGSGKSVAKEIALENNYNSISMGNAVRKKTKENWSEKLREANESDNKTTSTIYGEFATKMREKHGDGIVAEWCEDQFINKDGPYIIDGVRSLKEKTIFENMVDNMYIIFIHTPASIRLKRITNRNRDNEGTFTSKELLERDLTENKWGLPELIQQSDYTIHNCCELTEFENKINNIYTEINLIENNL